MRDKLNKMFEEEDHIDGMLEIVTRFYRAKAIFKKFYDTQQEGQGIDDTLLNDMAEEGYFLPTYKSIWGELQGRIKDSDSPLDLIVDMLRPVDRACEGLIGKNGNPESREDRETFDVELDFLILNIVFLSTYIHTLTEHKPKLEKAEGGYDVLRGRVEMVENGLPDLYERTAKAFDEQSNILIDEILPDYKNDRRFVLSLALKLSKYDEQNDDSQDMLPGGLDENLSRIIDIVYPGGRFEFYSLAADFSEESRHMCQVSTYRALAEQHKPTD